MSTKTSYFVSLTLILAIVILPNLVSSTVTANQITNITQNNLMFTGTISIGTTGERVFYVFYGKDGQTSVDNLANYPLVVAVGSVGRSAQYSNIGGFGPKFLMPQLNIIDNPYSLTQFANTVFIDQLGSGFSFPTTPSAIPSTAQKHGSYLTSILNTFTSESALAKSKKMYLVVQSTFLRIVPFLGQIDALEGIVHVSGWMDLYNIGKYYGVGGVEMKIFGDSERITIDGTFTNCYNFQRSSKFLEAHNCYDTTLNYVESKTKNRNLFNIQLLSNLTQFLPLAQYYFSQSSVANSYKAPTTAMFETYASQSQSNIYQNLATNIDSNFSQYLKDQLSVRHIFITGDYDFIVYRKGTRNWLQNTLQFVESAKFKPLNLTEFNVDGKLVGYKKAVNQIGYYELIEAGHFSYNQQPKVFNSIIREFIGVKGQKEHEGNLQVEEVEE